MFGPSGEKKRGTNIRFKQNCILSCFMYSTNVPRLSTSRYVQLSVLSLVNFVLNLIYNYIHLHDVCSVWRCGEYVAVQLSLPPPPPTTAAVRSTENIYL